MMDTMFEKTLKFNREKYQFVENDELKRKLVSVSAYVSQLFFKLSTSSGESSEYLWCIRHDIGIHIGSVAETICDYCLKKLASGNDAVSNEVKKRREKKLLKRDKDSQLNSHLMKFLSEFLKKNGINKTYEKLSEEHYFCRRGQSRGISFNDKLNILHNVSIIDEDMFEKLKEIKNVRNLVHLFIEQGINTSNDVDGLYEKLNTLGQLTSKISSIVALI